MPDCKENKILKDDGTNDVVAMHFRLPKLCRNCPFRKTGAIQLEPGRLQGIIDDLVIHDHTTFQCHVTVHGKTMANWMMIYLEKLESPTVAMRLGHLWGLYQPETFLVHHALVIDPPPAIGA